MDIKYKNEEWRKIPGYRGYEISNLGRIKTVDRYVNVVRNGASFKKFYKGIIKTSKTDGCGYIFTDLWKCGKYKFAKIHRLVLCTFSGKPQTYKLQVNHKDGIKSNNNLTNLEWVTPSQNSLHAIRTGLRKINKGIDSYQSKLTETNVKKIRKDFTGKRGELSSFGKKYGVSAATIRDVVMEETWKHLL